MNSASLPLRRPLIFLFMFMLGMGAQAQTTLIPPGAVWKYLANGSNQNSLWTMNAFNDGGWPQGAAELGYGDGDEATTLGYGPDANNKFITTYFRRTFNVADPSAFTYLVLRLKRDDGAVVYLNGVELRRDGFASGAHVTYTTVATETTSETAFFESTHPANLLLAGSNLLAVEIHQSSPTSSDISFNLELLASGEVPPLALTRGPYLQLATPESMCIRWRTNLFSDSRVRYGTEPHNLTFATDNPTQTNEHTVKLTGLAPNTTYYYSVGSTTLEIGGNDEGTFFTTSPPVGTSKPTRIWVLGDSGLGNYNVRIVRDAYYAYTGARRTDLWLMLGDNAYPTGTDAQFQSTLFNIFPATLRTSPLWPTFGNHDGMSASATAQSGPYFENFSLPKNAEAGGVPSNTEAYYSFDYGPIHFISLDSQESSRLAGSPMLTWLQSDLAATTQQWIIAFFHHPPYSKGAHNSDIENQLIDMRTNVLPILEAGGLDLCMTGHSHTYERSFLIDGHYGNSSTFTTATLAAPGNGRVDSPDGAYVKPSLVPEPHKGAVYAVSGSSSQVTTGGALNHPAMFTSFSVLGSMVLDFNANRLDAAFLDAYGAIRDNFTLVKAPGAAPYVNSITRLDANPTTASQVRFSIKFSEYMTGLDSADFTLSTSGHVTGASIASVTGEGSEWIVTVNTGNGLGKIRLDVTDNDTVVNSINAPLGGAGTTNGNFNAGEEYSVGYAGSGASTSSIFQ